MLALRLDVIVLMLVKYCHDVRVVVERFLDISDLVVWLVYWLCRFFIIVGEV